MTPGHHASEFPTHSYSISNRDTLRSLFSPLFLWFVVSMLCRKGAVIYFHAKRPHPSILATFDTTPSPHRRINAPSLLLAFAHIHGEAGTPTLGICSAVQCSAVQCSGESGRSVVSMLCRRGGYYFHAKQIIFRKDNIS
jgi:hypothetical protein